jgi:hypothetical protein
MSLSDWVCVGSLSRDWCRFVSIVACAKGRVLCRVCPLPVVCAQKKTASGDSARRAWHAQHTGNATLTHACGTWRHTHAHAGQAGEAPGLGGGGTTDEVVFWASGSLLLRWRVLRGLLRRLCRRPGAGQAGVRRTGGTSSTVGAPTRGAQAAASKLMRIETGGLSLGSRRAGTRGAVLKQGGRHFQQPSPLV